MSGGSLGSTNCPQVALLWVKIDVNCIEKLLFASKRPPPVSSIMLPFHVNLIYNPLVSCEGWILTMVLDFYEIRGLEWKIY